jgi:hypothetical protein
MCLYCVSGSSRSQMEGAYILDLLALIERQDLLPAENTLRIAQELLVWADQTAARLQCEAVAVPESDRTPRPRSVAA